MQWLVYVAFFLAALALVGEVMIGAAGVLLLISLLAGLSGASLLWWSTPWLDAWSTATILALIMGVLLVSGGVVYLALRLYKRRSVSGTDALLHATGRIIDVSDPYATYAEINGERWQVSASHPLELGQEVQVLSKQGLVLIVQAVRQHTHPV